MNARVHSPIAHPVGQLFADEGDFVFRTLRYLGVPPGLIDDALQDVFVTAYRRWDAFEGRSSARTWLYGIARRIAYRYRRRSKAMDQRFVLELVEGEVRPFEKFQARRSVAQLVASLSEPKRAAFILVEVEGLTSPEAAEALGVPLGTVYSRVRAAWQTLRAEASVEQTTLRAGAQKPKLSEERRATLQRGIMAIVLGKAAVPAVATVGWWGLGAALGAGTVALALAVSPTVPAPPSKGPAAAAEEPATPAPSEPPRLRSATSTARVLPPPIERAVPIPAAPPPDTVTSRTVRPPAAPTPTPSPSPTDTTTLAAELVLMRSAQTSLRKGDEAAARRALEAHARRYPRGLLREEREAALQNLAR